MDEYILDIIKKFVKEELDNDFSGHDYNHALRVYNNANNIIINTKDEKINKKIILTSCLLHDCVDHKLFSDITNQIEKIKKLLVNYYDEKEIKEIIKIIDSISFSKNNTLTDINAQIVCDADRLDAIGAIGIIRTIEYGACKKRKFDDDSKESTINHFYDKLLKLKDLMYTNYAIALAKERHQFLELFLKQYYKERKV